MFALNLVKLFVVAVIVAVLWYGFKAFRRAMKPGRGEAPDALEMQECPVCKTYRAAGAEACEREDCPYR